MKLVREEGDCADIVRWISIAHCKTPNFWFIRLVIYIIVTGENYGKKKSGKTFYMQKMNPNLNFHLISVVTFC